MTAHLFKAASLGLSFALNVMIARLLPIEQAGVLMTLLLLVPALSMVGRCGTDVFVLRYAQSAHQATGTVVPFSQLTRIAVAGSSTVALTAGALMFLASPVLEASAGVRAGAVVPLLASVPLQAVSILDSAALRAMGHFRLAPFLELGLAQGVSIAVFYPVSLVVDDPFTAFTIAWFLGWLATAIWSRTAARRALMGRRGSVRSLSIWPMAWIAVGGILHYSWSWAPVFAAWLALGPAEASIAVAMLKYVALLNLVQVIQLNSLLPQVAARWSAADPASVTALVRGQLLRALPVNALLAVSLAGLSGLLMSIYGVEYAHYGPLLAVTALLFGVIWSVFGFVAPVAAVLDQARTSTVWTLATTIAAGLLLVLQPGLTGVMVTYGALTFLLGLVVSRTVDRRTGSKVSLL